jgi:Fur family ferric uptake transcriptional regulator
MFDFRVGLGYDLTANLCSNKGLPMSCGERLAKELRKQGYRVTPQRAVILETIAHMDGHRTAQEVYQAAGERLPGLNLATIYRTLETLHAASLVDLFDTGGVTRFSLRDPEHLHGHLVCHRCGKTLTLDPAHAAPLAVKIHQKTGFEIALDHLTLVGLCEDCSSLDNTPTSLAPQDAIRRS